MISVIAVCISALAKPGILIKDDNLYVDDDDNLASNPVKRPNLGQAILEDAVNCTSVEICASCKLEHKSSLGVKLLSVGTVKDIQPIKFFK